MKPNDTHPSARAVQIRILRRMTAEQRFGMVEELTRDTTRWSRDALRELMPHASDAEIIFRWIELVYGEDLAERVRPLRDRLGARA